MSRKSNKLVPFLLGLQSGDLWASHVRMLSGPQLQKHKQLPLTATKLSPPNVHVLLGTVAPL